MAEAKTPKKASRRVGYRGAKTRLRSEDPLELLSTKRLVSGTNGLYRMNYCNGRMLTAEALRKEQAYGDLRARLVAEIHAGGVAWGLGLDVAIDGPPPYGEGLQGGMPLSTAVTLKPGLAFNGVGQ